MAGFEVIIYGRFWVIAEGQHAPSTASQCTDIVGETAGSAHRV